MMKKKETKSTIQKELDELRELATSAVRGYENYLKDEINYQTLAKIMKKLHDHLPIGK